MLPVNYSELADNTINSVAEYLESINTEGSGYRWKDQFLLKVKKYAQPVKYAICRYEEFAKDGFSCISIGNWIIVFKIKNESFNVYYIILGSNFK